MSRRRRTRHHPPRPRLALLARSAAAVGLAARLVSCLAVGLAGALAGCATAPARDATTSPTPLHWPLTWTLTLLPGGDVDVGAVDTVLCWRGPAPDHVGPENRRALPWLLDVPHRSDARGTPLEALGVDDTGIVTRGLPADSCVAFSVDVEAAARAIDDADVAAVVGRSVVGSPDAWLWRPMPWPSAPATTAMPTAPKTAMTTTAPTRARPATGRLVIQPTAGEPALSAALPFPRDDDGSWRVAGSAFALQCFTALGALQVRDVVLRGATLHIARVGGASTSGAVDGLDDDDIDEWLRVAVDDVAVPLGRFPVDEASLLLVSVRGRRPLLSGFLGRGGGTSALFYLGEGPFAVVDDPELLDEDGRWVFTHELAHTLLPPVTRGDGWLNEGLTTWHQEVLPAAVGRRTRSAAAAQLRVGFTTGASRAARDGLSVEESCRQMDARGSHQHCYWAGARLIELLADDVGDDGVFALVRVLHALRPTDAQPLSAVALLTSATTSTDQRAAQAATALLALWEQHRGAPFPIAGAPQMSPATPAL